ncbi:hypothetical protein [Paractinoplanes maris]|uniref:hypothetical protein n=1 Tax=Paractinoplanes maris TaxID=1734446 RepID=UPI002020A529|nr:hypothetical protein [Actinoplanes maris]
MPIKTEVYRRDTPQGPDTVTVMASIDDDGAEIRVVRERGGRVIADTIPHWGDDPAAGHRWIEEFRGACLGDGFQLVEEGGRPQQ